MIRVGAGIDAILPSPAAPVAEPDAAAHQYSLDDALQLQAGARATDPATSHQAAEASRANQGRLMRLVLAAHAAHPRGLTDDELSGDLLPDEHPGSVSRRRGTLRDLGYIGDTGERRTTRWGRQAVVWQITRAGLAALDAEG